MSKRFLKFLSLSFAFFGILVKRVSRGPPPLDPPRQVMETRSTHPFCQEVPTIDPHRPAGQVDLHTCMAAMAGHCRPASSCQPASDPLDPLSRSADRPALWNKSCRPGRSALFLGRPCRQPNLRRNFPKPNTWLAQYLAINRNNGHASSRRKSWEPLNHTILHRISVRIQR